MTFSGVCTLARRDAVYAVGGFRPEMATEDIVSIAQAVRGTMRERSGAPAVR